ncbi:bifunctional serine/threonine-protein kinase/formylglycine-generating enzyme family protein [Synechococcus sp. PCC 7502]|uniref:bifunctional serine/threonine-protein kinase/formylglycine-generating enzyme family protein n=1 Tax=Synechococcus sp. PCC 7502 TaxID=1173263 RepID=UPI0002D7A2DD|nr:bifunctional serine/threonine-protein kinase/formylglycine-generating enzyme family protein [Synechococcus sp. PCC 7502]
MLVNDRYRALKVLGRGGFGRTFLAIDEAKPSRPPCVIKQFLPVENEFVHEARRLFKQEAVRLDDLGKHSQIPELYAYTEQENRLYLVQQFVNGNNLGKELSKEGVFDEVKIRKLLNDLLPVLQFMHDAQVIHRDIKPDNIIRRRSDGKPVLVDFGAAKFATATSLAKVGTTIGTVGYASPEQSLGKAIFSSDIYSLGVTCIYLLTGVEPYNLFDVSEGFVWRHRTDGVSDRLAQVLDKMIHASVKQRYTSATEVIKDLNSGQQTIKKNSSKAISIPSSKSLLIKLKKFKFETVRLKVPSNKQVNLLSRKILTDSNITIEKRTCQVEYFIDAPVDDLLIEMIKIPEGNFLMGSSLTEEEQSKDETPQHLVNVPTFFLGKYPVTQAQWQMVMDNNPSRFKGANLPVENVSWHDAQDFCHKLAEVTGKPYRLPSEAEWEYACRAGTITPFYFGEVITADFANFNGQVSYANSPKSKYRMQTTEVNVFPPNAFGLFDMHGNVWEWCQDEAHDHYRNAPIDGSAWEGVNSSGTGNRSRVLRGGAWNSNPSNCRSAFRNGYFPDSRFDRCGFRIAFSI